MWTSVWVFLNFFPTTVDTHTLSLSYTSKKNTVAQKKKHPSKAVFTEVQTYITIQS